MKKLYLIPLALIAIITSRKVNAQSFAPALSIPVTVNGNTLVNAWAGGLNSPQFSEIDLNGDGIKDLFVFEAEGASQSYFVILLTSTMEQQTRQIIIMLRNTFRNFLQACMTGFCSGITIVTVKKIFLLT